MIGSFKHREDAGKRLAAKLELTQLPNPVVIALPRGGVPVANEVARVLQAPLQILPVRKIGAPGNPELAIGAVAPGEPPVILLDPGMVELLRVTPAYIEAETQRQFARIEQQQRLFDVDPAPFSLEGCTAIVVDDGIATGATMRAALQALRQRRPAALVLAVPVGEVSVLARLRKEVDNLVCVIEADYLGGVGAFYRDFTQVEDDAVIALIREAATRSRRRSRLR